MITVRLYGLLRLDSGIRQKTIEAGSVKDVFAHLQSCGIAKTELNSCIILINGKNGTKRSKLTDGDTVILMSPVAGG